MAVLKKEQIITEVDFKSKEEVFYCVANKALELNIISDKNEFIKGLFEREEEMSTCFDYCIAIPHCRNNCINNAAVFIVKSNQNIQWDNENTANFIILLAVPNDTVSTHIKLLSSIARKLVDEEFVDQILSTNCVSDILECFREFA